MESYLDHLERAACAAGVDLAKACRRAGVAATTLSRWRRGDTSPQYGTAAKILGEIRRISRADPAAADSPAHAHGTALAAAIAERGLSDAEVARAADCAASTISRVRRGLSEPSPELRARLEGVFGRALFATEAGRGGRHARSGGGAPGMSAKGSLLHRARNLAAKRRRACEADHTAPRREGPRP